MIVDIHGNPIKKPDLKDNQSAKLSSLQHEFAGHPSRGLTPAKAASIVDIHDNPIKKPDLKDNQSAKLSSLQHEFAGHPSRGLTPAKAASILQSAEQGDLIAQFDLFEDMEEKDTQILSEMSKRKRALMKLGWSIKPPRNATAQEMKATEQVAELVASINDVEDIIFDLADGIGKGFSCLEYEGGWQQYDNEWLPKRITYRPQRWFTTPQNKQNEIRLRGNGGDGDPLWHFGWICHHHKSRSGYIGRSGLFRTLVWPYIFKNYSVRDLAEFLEIYGLPLRLGKYPSGASNTEKMTLLKAVVNIGHDAAGIIPQGMEIDFKEAAKGDKDPFEYMIGWCERSISKVITGTTAPTDGASSGGNRALGDYSKEVLWDITVSDARQIDSTLTKDLVWPITALNTGITDPRRSPRWVSDTNEYEDIKLFSASLPNLVDIGMEIPEQWAKQKIGVPEVEEGKKILQRSASVTVPVEAASAAARAALKAEVVERDLADALADQIEKQTNAATTEMIEKIRKIALKADSLQQLSDELIAAFKYLDETKLAEIMRMGFAVAELGGRYEAQESI